MLKWMAGSGAKLAKTSGWRRLKVVYVANVRLPTEKAHGYQIMKMCEAFSELGCEVVLLRAHRYQQSKALRSTDPFEYYSVKRIFRIVTVPFPDMLLLEARLPGPLFRLLQAAAVMMWGLTSAVIARAMCAGLYYTREPSCAFFLALMGMRPVFEAHGVSRGVRLLAKWKMVRKRVRMTVAVTGQIKLLLEGLGFRETSVIVQPDAVDLSMYEGIQDKVQCRRMLNLPLDAVIVGFVGRFQAMGQERGVPELVRAVGELRRSGDCRVMLLCVGGPMDNVNRYLELAKEVGIPEDKAVFVDRVPTGDVPYWIKALDVAVIPYPPSEHYSLFVSPMKAFEYMAAGVPMVASDLPSLREILRHGENAFLVEPDCPASLSEGIAKILKDDALRDRIESNMSAEIRKHSWKDRARAIIGEAGKRDER